MKEQTNCSHQPQNCSQDENCQRIIEHGKERFFKEGFSKITMDEIANDLQMSKKTIYKYFDSKKCLVETVTESFIKKVAEEISGVINSSDNAVLKIIRLLKFFTTISHFVSEKLIIDLQRKFPPLWKRIDEFRTKMMLKNMTRLIDQGKKEGNIKNYPTEIMITMIVSSVRSIVNPEFLINHNYSIKKAFMTSFEILFNGILTEKGKEIFNNYKKEA